MTLGKPTATLRLLAFGENLHRLEARWQVFISERIRAMLVHVRVKSFHGTERAVHVDGTVEGPSLKSGPSWHSVPLQLRGRIGCRFVSSSSLRFQVCLHRPGYHLKQDGSYPSMLSLTRACHAVAAQVLLIPLLVTSSCLEQPLARPFVVSRCSNDARAMVRHSWPPWDGTRTHTDPPPSGAPAWGGPRFFSWWTDPPSFKALEGRSPLRRWTRSCHKSPVFWSRNSLAFAFGALLIPTTSTQTSCCGKWRRHFDSGLPSGQGSSMIQQLPRKIVVSLDFGG